MKKILVALSLLVITSTAIAQHHGFRHHGHHGHYRGHGANWWIAPVVVGAISYELGRQQRVIVEQQPIIIQQPMPGTNCTEWKEIHTSDGRIYRERTCTQ